MAGHVQAIRFDRVHWTPKTARVWLRDHGYAPARARRVDVTANELRYRIREPSPDFIYRYVSLSRGGPVKGVRAVMGFPSEARAPVVLRTAA